MKKGFTLVEMLVVVVVIVTLMTMTFRLTSVGSSMQLRNKTIDRLNRIENCLSGYYAAFGGYPPVKLHGTRNIYARVSSHGIQSESDENKNIWGWAELGTKEELEAWEQVKAACKSQPVDCRFPFPAESAYNVAVKAISDSLQKLANKSSSGLTDARKKALTSPFDNGVTDNLGRHDGSEYEWSKTQLFKFGLMSYLLPRYLVMMNSDEKLFQGGYRQWEYNNTIPCNPLTGFSFSNEGGWKAVREKSLSTDNPSDMAAVANIPSQAVTARWMPNLEGLCCCNHDFELFGISIRGDVQLSELRADNTDIEVYSPGGYDEDSGANQYVLDSVTVKDGWGNEFYYYSPPPHQNYTLWSAGPNNRTFPPWISRKRLDAKANRCVGLWVEDDIVRMSN